MARQLWLLRHGEAVPHDSKDDDADRELTARGERQSAAAGAALARLGVEFAAIYTSPKVRAADTARLAAEALSVDPEEEELLANGFDREDALELVGRHDDGARVLVVGHEPSFSQVVHDLTGGRVDFKKGAVAAIRLEGSRGELIVLLRPRELESLAITRLSAALATASATAARDSSESATMYSSGLCAAPPRGPRPSTVSGIAAAKWLASLAPPRGIPTTGRPSAALARSSSGAVASVASMPGHSRTMSGCRVAPPTSAGIASTTRWNASEESARMSLTSSPEPGTTLNAAPEFRTVGTAVRRSGPSGSWQPATAWAAAASASSALRPRSGAEPECEARPSARTFSVPAALRRTHDAVVALRRARAALEAEAGVEAREALHVAERRRPPLLVADQQQRDLGVVLRARGQRAHDAEREHDAALHVDRARPDHSLSSIINELQ